ncbi:MAG TPA: helix-turn-helix transcriptional regulator [Chloroflexota bacterium]|jgi:transcriptional regulator with XRE-family HTH domain
MNGHDATENKAVMGTRFRALRERAGLTQAQVANRLGVSEGAYRAYEAGRNEPSFTAIPALAEALGVQPADLFPSPACQEAASLEHELVQNVADFLRGQLRRYRRLAAEQATGPDLTR